MIIHYGPTASSRESIVSRKASQQKASRGRWSMRAHDR
jgi:hypothetical protein